MKKTILIQKDMRRRWIIFALLCPLFLIISLVVSYFLFEFSTADDQGFKDFLGEGNVIQDSFSQFFKNKKDYPAYSMEQLQRMGAIEDESCFEYWLYYTPFSSKTSDDKIVLRMGYGPFGFIPPLCELSWTKYQLTHVPKWDENPWKDRLQATKERQVQQFAMEHSSYDVVAAFAWFNGTVPEDSHAELIIEYRMQNDPKTYRVHYDLYEKNDDWVVETKPFK